MSTFGAGDEYMYFRHGGQTHFAMETNTLKMHFQTSATHTYTHTHSYMYQQLPNRTYLKMIATHRYSPPKMDGSYHALKLTSEHTTPTSDIYIVVFSAGLNGLQVDRENDK